MGIWQHLLFKFLTYMGGLVPDRAYAHYNKYRPFTGKEQEEKMTVLPINGSLRASSFRTSVSFLITNTSTSHL